jgi:dTDP-glucose pyrophosphorylase/CBS domain-containing protein
MDQEKLKKIDRITLNGEETILFALKKMDNLEKKLLIILNGNKFAGLLSIGDIQRAIIKNIPLETMVKDILRDGIMVARPEDDQRQTRLKMMEERIECMPVIDHEDTLVDVIFWEDIISGEVKIREKLNVPVVIMAGGEGTRLKPLTNVLPKPLIPVVDKTIIEDIMDQFVKAGCREFHISLNYKAEMIKNYLNNLNNPDYRINFFQEEKPLGTAGSLYLLSEKMTSTFFVSNCDIIIKQDLVDVFKYHIENENKITVVAALKHYKIPYGTIESGEGGLLDSLSEKPEITFKINSGVYILEPDVLKLIPKEKFYHITDLILKLKNKKERVGIFPISEKSWIDYGLLENLPFISSNRK